MAKYPFLSEDWLVEARRIYAAAELSTGPEPPEGAAPVRVNLTVSDVPFSSAPVDAHVDTAGGRLTIDVGHLPDADVTVSLEYATARSLFVAGDVQSVMQAFLSGRIKVDGDLSKLLDPRNGVWAGGAALNRTAVAGGATDGVVPTRLGLGPPDALEIAARLQEITD